MEITSIKVFPVAEDRLKAFATIVFDNCFVIRDLKVIKGNKGLFVAMPSKRCKDGTFKDMAHPLNSETRTDIEDKVLNEYYSETGQSPQPKETVPVSEGDAPLDLATP
jgi:stage V sporulation protein G